MHPWNLSCNCFNRCLKEEFCQEALFYFGNALFPGISVCYMTKFLHFMTIHKRKHRTKFIHHFWMKTPTRNLYNAYKSIQISLNNYCNFPGIFRIPCSQTFEKCFFFYRQFLLNCWHHTPPLILKHGCLGIWRLVVFWCIMHNLLPCELFIETNGCQHFNTWCAWVWTLTLVGGYSKLKRGLEMSWFST